MAKDSLSMRLENGVLLDKILSEMQQRIGTKIIEQSLNKGAAELRKNMKKEAPKGKKDATGHVKYASRNHTKGTLRKSIKSGLRKRVNVGRHTFLAGVWFDNMTGWYAPMVIKRYDKANAFGQMGGNNFVKRAVSNSKGAVRRVIGEQVAQKIADQTQKEINSKLK